MKRHPAVFHRLNRRLREIQSTSFSGIDPSWFYDRGSTACARDLAALKKRFASRRPAADSRLPRGGAEK